MSDKLIAYYATQTREFAKMEEAALVPSLQAIEKNPRLRDVVLYGSTEEVEDFFRTNPCYEGASGAFYGWWVVNLKCIVGKGVDAFINSMEQ